jgi:hypothetical protein
MFCDVLVGHIRSTVYPHRLDERISGRSIEALIRHQDRLDPKAFGGTEDKLLDIARRRIRIYPDLQSLSLSQC